MALVFGRLLLALIFSLCFVAVVAPRVAPAADLTVILDQARLIKLPDKVATVVVGNPLIADVSIQPGGLAVVTGKGYGRTNLIVLDRVGTALLERSIEVRGPRENIVIVYRGVERETYSCTPSCERRITLGDSNAYFEAVIKQIGDRSGQAQGLGPAAK